MDIYLVGGAVRDSLMGMEPNDLDYVVVDSSVEEMVSLGFELITASFPVFHHPLDKNEYALARTERKEGKGYTGFVTETKHVSLEQDLSRRDLTINSMARNIDGMLIDPHGGKEDIRTRTLRHTSDSFRDDPVRALRVARMYARLGHEWTIHADTMAMIKEMSRTGEFVDLTGERIWKEMVRALDEPYPELFFETLVGLGIFPEIDAMVGVPQPPNHHPEGDVFVHTMLCLKRAVELNYSTQVRFCALTHDFGKPYRYKLTGTFHGHERDGVSIITDFCTRLRIPKVYRRRACMVSEFHTHGHIVKEMTPAKLYKLLLNIGALGVDDESFNVFIQSCQVDSQGRGPTKKDVPYDQANYLTKAKDAINSMDTHGIVASAKGKGKVGSEIGEELQIAYIATLRAINQ